MLRIVSTIVTLKIGVRPSEILGIDVESNSWLAYCFDEACAFIIAQLKDGKKPIMRIDENNEIRYSKPSDLYNKYK